MEQLSCLCDLENCQNSLRTYTREMDSLERESMANKRDKKLDDLEGKLEKIKVNQTGIKNKLREAEGKLKNYTFEYEQIEKSLYDGSTSDIKQLEYLDLEKNKLRDTINKTEIEIIESMEGMETLDRELIELEKLVRELKARNSELREEYKKAKENLNKKVKLDEEKILVLEKAIEKKLLDKYYKIRRSKGTAIAIVKDTSCGGCNMFIPMMLIDRLNKGEEIIYCENCGRILCKL